MTASMLSLAPGNFVMFFSKQSSVFLPSSHLHWQGDGQELTEVINCNREKKNKAGHGGTEGE